ncbi:MAG TPA: hypothetical protein VFR58_07310 [Flavisolibacter sp.]|nr:hypothetical protein [Flavisolibacter sp.]
MFQNSLFEKHKALEDVQQRLIQLQHENLNLLTGGDSYCIVYPSLQKKGDIYSMSFVMVNYGNFPLKDVEIRVTDLRYKRKLQKRFAEDFKDGKKNFDDFDEKIISPDFVFKIPFLPQSIIKENGYESSVAETVEYPRSRVHDELIFNIFIRIPNGNYTQQTIIRDVTGTRFFWVKAVRILPNSKDYKFERIDPMFLKEDEAAIDWDSILGQEE